MRLVESKRLGRTLPAVINGLSAAQAQSQGFIEEPSDADTASVANSETLFVDESDDESTSSRSRSGSPHNNQDGNGQSPQLNPAATPFAPKPTTTAPTPPNPFAAATTFGKPSGTQIQTNSTPVFDFSSKSTNQAANNPFKSKELPKFSFFPPGNGTISEESNGIPSVFNSKEHSKASFFPSQSTPKTEEKSKGPVLASSDATVDKKSIFGQPSTTYPATTTPEPIKAAVENSTTLNEAAVPSSIKSVFDQPAALSTPPVFSFETSPLFESARAKSKSPDSKENPLQISEEKTSTPSASQPENAAIKPPAFTTLSTPKSTPFSLFPPSNPLTEKTNPPQAAPLGSPTTNGTQLPKPEPQFNWRSSQPAPSFASSTAPSFPPTLSSQSNKPFEAIQKPKPALEPTTFTSQALKSSPVVNRSGSQPSPKPSNPAPSQLDPRSAALDKLSKIMLLEDNGIIQHFIEFAVGPIIKASIIQFDDESSWKEASQSSPSGFQCGERMLIGNRGMSCTLVG